MCSSLTVAARDGNHCFLLHHSASAWARLKRGMRDLALPQTRVILFYCRGINYRIRTSDIAGVMTNDISAPDFLNPGNPALFEV